MTAKLIEIVQYYSQPKNEKKKWIFFLVTIVFEIYILALYENMWISMDDHNPCIFCGFHLDPSLGIIHGCLSGYGPSMVVPK
jgi:hypothetical protein